MMRTPLLHPIHIARLLAAAALVACSAATRSSGSAASLPPPATPAAQAAADAGRPPYTRADVRFMQGMIRHHAQALLMAAWAKAHATRNGVRILAERIDVGQRDEIATMASWLRDRGEAVPDTSPRHHGAGHQTQASGDLMPGMLTHDQLSRLEQSRGPEFDRLFLTFMIQHHEGALAMVRELFASPGAGQDVTIFRFASDVEADQTTEIDRMRSMLASHGNQP